MNYRTDVDEPEPTLPPNAVRGANLALERANKHMGDVLEAKYPIARLVSAVKEGKLRIPAHMLRKLEVDALKTLEDVAALLEKDMSRLREFNRRRVSP